MGRGHAWHVSYPPARYVGHCCLAGQAPRSARSLSHPASAENPVAEASDRMSSGPSRSGGSTYVSPFRTQAGAILAQLKKLNMPWPVMRF